MNNKAPLEDQRTLMCIIRALENPPDENVRETELVRKADSMSILHPDECITELLAAGLVYRVKGPSGVFIRRNEE
jgi:hypothetical protein